MTRHPELTSWISEVSTKWLADVATTANLWEAIEGSGAEAPPAAVAAQTPGPLLFPLLYHHRPRITSALFHQMVDACQEARRNQRRLCLVGAAVGRGEPVEDASYDLTVICDVLNDEGWPADLGGEVAELDDCARHLAARARRTSYTRRATDLPDLLISAAYDAVGASAVYLGEGVNGGRCIGRLPTVAPLGRLHTPGDPFASAPEAAKLRPAGYDQVWGAAFTLGETNTSAVTDDERPDVVHKVRQRLEPTWRALRRAGLTAHSGLAPSDSRRVVASGERRAKVAVPLFGARTISAPTISLVKATAALGEVTLVVDDLTPLLLYRSADAAAIRAGFRQLAARTGGQVSFLGDLDATVLQERIQEVLERLTMAELIAASPHGKPGRSRPTFTGYDAIHLAIMAVACGLHDGSALAAQAANVPAVRALSHLHGIDSLVVRSGPAGPVRDHEFRLDAAWLSSPTENGADHDR
ncbi:hypothetical protein [Catellatospora chokoriensis]|uniref:Uncharacterized protein n=1 Tax=Catellatospora chokoriensis TaxID=310353 RepID=A0A8J3NRQ7_9ACTN|nr:hypothetical protein [Catellatospora chokoriensis]GIF90432.1 hypothetical protein Cch02nite_38760 [Catellatospora chokoriensis]